ncbi:MAG: YihY/virulence factor BrkB family protein [Nostocoides sp.]
MKTVRRLWTRLQGTWGYRGWKRYGDARGNLLAGGVTYFAFLSVFPAIALAFTIFGALLRGHPDWLGQISGYLDTTLPGFVKDDANPTGLIPLSIPSRNTLSITGVVAVLGLVLSGLGWLAATRDGIRAIFGAKGSPGNVLTDKLRDLAVLVVFGVGIVLSAAVTGVAGAVTGNVAEWIGLGGQGWILTVVGVLLGIVLDGALVAVMLRVLSGVDLPWRGVRNGALAGGIGLTLLKVFGTTLVAGTLRNPVYGSIALVVGLLVWLNFISRIVLLSAAWAANDLDDAEPTSAQTRGAGAVPDPADRVAAGLPTFGQRAADRWTLAAGAVLGAAGVAGLGAVARSVLRLIRPRAPRN